ncbi:hypothetical protein IV203_021415 [Nitzschia inconspicua]|uniref:Uncharacterized protein n=1 Tax=Nitzschia inconspicua TaxID=303405 RepID=A0A9K3KHV9_9STRA|nr:hypothetical protein IV203_021415 [Nitzschia inconspicua]
MTDTTDSANSSRKRTIEEVEFFLVPSSVDELFERIWEEVALSLSQIEDHSFFRERIHRQCQRFSPCETWEMYREVVDFAQGLIQGYKEGRLKERRKVSVAALMELKEGDILLQVYMGSPNSNINPSGHSFANGKQKQLDLKTIPLDEDERCGIRSCFMQGYLQNSEGPEIYQTESDIQHIVQVVLEDAVAACNELLRKFRPRAGASGEILGEEGGYRILQCYREQSLWTDRRDHVVVCDSRSGAPLLTVETKVPVQMAITQSGGFQRRSVFTDDKTLGQRYDCLRLMQFMGHQHPIHVTTTIEETSVAWLEDNPTMENYSKSSSDAAACWAAAAEKTFKKLGMEQLTTEQSTTDCDVASTGNAGAQSRSRPQSSAICEVPLARNIIHSQTFKPHQLFHLFVDAILYGLLGAYSSPVLPTLKAGERVSFRLALKLTYRRFEWVLINATVTGPLPSRKRGIISQILQNGARMMSTALSPHFYAIGVVGVGATSKFFRVITQDGYEGVAKIYIRKHRNGKIELPKAEFLKEAHQCTSTERAIFNATYPEVPVSKVMLNGHPSLLMPCFGSIEHPDGTWKEKVMAALRVLKDGNGCHLKYYDDDVNWRHIGLCRESGKVIFFDFNDVEVIPSKDQIEDEVKRQWEILAGSVRQGINNAI